ncbi:efflux RND transporter periplasmic adaptor subunit [Clostridium brassicae]|uniref:Efflux RND transporter periplasmic adaptor subunit n=1 Tax=Clostridium brassicae TaxID=2999072 RepID=A0ABT4D928_9CLOT|nr:efflux RND transporter periplasmic adaptor subunit [Clostridium brassicae]MCY6958813.1 efflux RND transporter periplasmic adaptor subunit [Clostridium brassicae]
MENHIKKDKKNKIITILIVVFISIMVFCTYFSKTIKNMLLPEVNTVYIKPGTIGEGVEFKGIVQYENTHKIVSKPNWSIKEIKVKVNQDVKKGDVLASVDNDEITLNEKIQKVKIMKLENELKNLKNSPKPSKSKEGDESKTSLGKKDNPKSNDNRIKEVQFELETENMQYKEIRKGLTKDGNILSDIDGKIVSIGRLLENDDVSAAVSAGGTSLFEIASSKTNFSVRWTVASKEGEKYSIGDKINAFVPSGKKDSSGNIKEKKLSSSINQKKYIDQKEEYEFSADIKDKVYINQGDKVTITTAESTKRYNNVIPKSCLNEDQGKSYIFLVKQRGGALGSEFYVEKVFVQLVAYDDQNCSIKPYAGNDAIKDSYGIVSNTSKPLTENTEVKLQLTGK